MLLSCRTKLIELNSTLARRLKPRRANSTSETKPCYSRATVKPTWYGSSTTFETGVTRNYSGIGISRTSKRNENCSEKSAVPYKRDKKYSEIIPREMTVGFLSYRGVEKSSVREIGIPLMLIALLGKHLVVSWKT